MTPGRPSTGVLSDQQPDQQAASALRPYGVAAGALISTTIATAVTVALTPGVAPALRDALGFSLTAPGRPPAPAPLFLHNLRPVLGVLLAAITASHLGRGRLLLDGALLIFLAANTTAIGATIGAYGLRAAQRLPHLPLEYAALTIVAGTYLAHRHHPPTPVRIAATTTAAALALAAAALLENSGT